MSSLLSKSFTCLSMSAVAKESGSDSSVRTTLASAGSASTW